MASVDKRSITGVNSTLLSSPGPYLARIVNNVDPTKQGCLEVELLRPIGNQKEESQQLFVVRYLSPFYGCTSVDFTGSNASEFNDTQKSYGFWAVPPDVGVTVMVIFVDSDPGQGFWMGCVQDALMNHMIPGIAGSTYTQEQTRINSDTEWMDTTSTQSHFGTTFLPVGEVNRQIFKIGQATPNPDVEANKKPIHPIAERLLYQGLINDPHRGVHTSSARRESPSNVYGWSTPGPIDKRKDAKKGMVGRARNKINKFVSRLGGHCIVMDDGDERFLRKTRPWEGPPEYADLEKGESGLVDFPKDESFRIRTRRGAQILLHSSEDFIFICNSRATAWIELTSNGKIEMYAQEGVHIGSGADIQTTSARNTTHQVNGDYIHNVTGNTVNETNGDHSTSVTGSSFHHCQNDHSIMAGNYLYTEGQSGHQLKGDAINFTGTSYEWTIAGNLLLNVQGNFEVRSQNALLTADNQTHIVSGSDTRIGGRDIHVLSGNDTTMNAYGNFNLASDNMITVNAGQNISMKAKVSAQIQAKGGALGLKAAKELNLDAGTDINVASGANILIDAKSEIHMQNNEAGTLDDAYEQPYPAKEPIEADQATGAPGMQTAGGGYSTVQNPNSFPVPGWGASINKRVPTVPGVYYFENENPESCHVRRLNIHDQRTVIYRDGKEYTIRTPQDMERVGTNHGGYSGGDPSNIGHSNVDTPNLRPSYNARPLDRDYTPGYPAEWTKDKEFISKSSSLASKYGMTLSELLSMFYAETSGTMSPNIKNPRSTATGLIQFIESTAQSLGTSTGALRQMSRVQQLEYVDKYLSQYRVRGAEDAYLAIAGKKGYKIAEGEDVYRPGTPEYYLNRPWIGPDGRITKASMRAFIARAKKRVERELQAAGISTGSGPSYPTTPGVSINPNATPQSGISPATPTSLPSQQFLNTINPSGGTNPK